MGFVKKNAFLLGCAVVALASLACMGWGIARMSLVREDMQRSQKLNASFANISKHRINIKSIDFENKRIELIGRHHQEVIDQFTESCDRKPLIENLFPDPPAGEEGRRLQYDFPPQYRKAMQDLVEKLNAGHPPTAREVEDTKDYLKKKALQAAQFEDAMGGSNAGSTGTSPPAPGGRQMPGSGRAEKDALPAVEGPQSAKSLWSALEEKAKHDPEMLSSISRAREIRCYADTAIGGTFDYHLIYRETDRRPTMKEIWEAQLLYWMQADVVDAIAAVNDKAAEQLGDGEKFWVGNMPVKDVFSIRVSDYVNEDSAGGGGRSDASDLPPVDPDEACTHQVTESLYDVINIRVVLAIDVRDLPIILGEFMHQRYFTVLNVGYTTVRPSIDFRGKIYGPEPVAKATIDLQAYLCYRSFVPLMPESIREWLGTQAQFEDLMKEKEKAQPDAEQGDSKT